MKDFMTKVEQSGFVPEIAPYERNDPYGEKLRMEAYAIGANRLLIPTNYLQGTQTADGYGSHKGKRAEKALETYGMNFLLKYPIIATAIFTDGNADIYVEDGHHRTIKAIKHDFPEMPTLLLTVEQMSEVQRHLGRIPNTPKEVGLKLIMESFEAIDSLQRRGVKNFGLTIQGVSNMKELTTRFATF